ncbi:hypothetical protein MKX03_017700 [Papaver bracteatum]|nr:hypothetical protein MKX03_017700 [Papaver bracteatum]
MLFKRYYVVILNFHSILSFIGTGSPGDYGMCYADQRVETGNFSSCDMCHAVCKSSSECIPDSTNTRAYISNCCVKIKGHPSGTGATTTSFALLSFPLIFSFILNILFI